MQTLKKEIYILLAVLLSLLMFFGKIQIKQKNLSCLTKTTKFLNAVKLQKQGVHMIRNIKTNITNYEETLADIPNHFNVGKLAYRIFSNIMSGH
jgi:hypothetical protein